jgi:hypothetical protein
MRFCGVREQTIWMRWSAKRLKSSKKNAFLIATFCIDAFYNV